MDILTSNATITRKFSIELQDSKDSWKAERQNIRDKIAETATAQARLMLTEEDDIGNPAQLCEVLSKLRLEYTEITVREKEEQEQIMKDYTEQTISNMDSLATSSYNWLTNKNVRLQEEITKMLPPPSWSGPPGGDQKMEVPFL